MQPDTTQLALKWVILKITWVQKAPWLHIEEEITSFEVPSTYEKYNRKTDPSH
jgi:hypothetical protein